MPDTILQGPQDPFRPFACTFTVVVSGGTGSHVFTNPINRKSSGTFVNVGAEIAAGAVPFYAPLRQGISVY